MSEPPCAIDERPIVLCRDHIPDEMILEVDEWIPKHFDDSLRHEAVMAAASFRVSWGLPPTFVEAGCRVIIYVAAGMQGLLEWLDSPELREAIEDGKDREAQVHPVDGEPFTGNIYAVTALRGSVEQDFLADQGILVERYEVPDALCPEFDAWFTSEHLEAVAAWPGCFRARAWTQNRSVPLRFPFDRYVSKGNRLLSAEFAPDVDMSELPRVPEVWKGIADSVRWDVRLPYARREAGSLIVARSGSPVASG